MKKTILQTLKSSRTSLRNSTNYARSPRGFVLIPLMLVCFALCPQVQSATDTPDPGPLPISNTADGQLALFGLTTGIYNSAFGIYALLSNADANFNTGVGGATLLSNTGNENTAVGAGALLSNTVGTSNTAVGAFAGFSNSTGTADTAIGNRALQNDTAGSNTAVGFEALQASTTGFNNAAFGVRPLENNIDGGNNTAIGNLALMNSESTSDHVCVGRLAGSGITTANNNIIIGHHSGVHPDPAFGQISDRCFIANIHGAPVSSNFDPQPVMVDSEGRLGTFVLAAGARDTGGFYPHGGPRQAVPHSTKDAALNLKVEKLQATVAQQEKQIEILTTELKEQAAQIQKVSAQLQVSKPAAQVVSHEQ